MLRFIYITKLRELLAVDDSTLAYWHRKGILIPVSNDDAKRYEIATVNAFLASRQRRGMAKAPTVAELESGAIQLVTPVKAAVMLNLTIDGLNGVLLRGRISAIKLLSEYRYELASLQRYLAARNNDEFLPRTTVEHVIGLSRPSIRSLQQQGRLIDASDTYRRRFTRDSVLALLHEMLAGRTDPRDWLDDRLESTRPLLTARSVAHTRDDEARIYGLLDRRELQYVDPPRGFATRGKLISPDSWLAYIERTEPVLSEEAIAKAFAVTRGTVAKWRKDQPGCLTCTEHDHLEDHLRYTCVLVLLRRYLSPGTSATLWYRNATEERFEVIRVQQAGKILNVPEPEVIAMLERGELHGMRTPNGPWLMSRTAVRRVRDGRTEARKAAQS